MFNEYGLYQMAKLRREEVERITRDSLKFYIPFLKKKKSKKLAYQATKTVNKCNQCACA